LIFIRQRTLADKRPDSAGVFFPKWSMALAKTFQTACRILQPRSAGNAIEVVSKSQVRLKSKAQTDEKAQHTR
jgi:hypothetical protein